MSSLSPSRRPAGTSRGGQFAAKQKAESCGSLSNTAGETCRVGSEDASTPVQLLERLTPGRRELLGRAAVVTSVTTRTLVRGLLAKVSDPARLPGAGPPGAGQPSAGLAGQAAQDAELALLNRGQVGTVPGWGPDQYRELTRPWRATVGTLHPDDVTELWDEHAYDPHDPFDVDLLHREAELEGDPIWRAARVEAEQALDRFAAANNLEPPF